MAEASAPQHATQPDGPTGPAVTAQRVLSYATPIATHGSAGRVEMIDAVRGLACLWVLMHHSYLYWVWRIHMPVLHHLQDVAWLGYHGVHLFLVISGFVLFFPVVRKHGVRGVRMDNRSFFHRRFRRILPPYYAALILFALLSLWPFYGGHVKVFTAANIAEHVSMTYNLDPRYITSFNGAFWSLALEFQLYLTFPLLLWGCRKLGLWPTVIAALTVSVVWQSVIVPRLIVLNGIALHKQQWPVQAAWYNALPGRWFEFVLGAAMAALVLRPIPFQKIIAAVAVAVCIPIAAFFNLKGGGTYMFGPVRDQLWGVGFAGVLLLSASTPVWLARSFVTRLIAWSGGISYSIYLTHEPILHLSQPLLDKLGIRYEIRLPLFIFVGLPILVAVGFAFHVAFERPFMSAKRPPITPDAPPPEPIPVASATP